jgi:RND family efflux transporter MFP subunit
MLANATPPLRGALFLAVLAVAGCSKSAPPSRQEEAGASIAKVKVNNPIRRDVTRKIEQPGEIRAFEETPIHARISGYVAKVYRDVGDRVKKGSVLAELSVPEMEEELAQKSALVDQAADEIKQAEALLKVAEKDVTIAAAKVKEAEASKLRASAELKRAESQLERLKKSEKVLTREQLEEAQLSVDTAQAALAEVDAKAESARAGEGSTRARRDKAEADVKVARVHRRVADAEKKRMAALLEYANLRAPFDGVVTRRTIDPGHYLQATETRREAAFVVASIDPVRVWVDVPESEAILVRDETRATVSVEALKGLSLEGEVTRSAWALDPKARTLRVAIDLKNPDEKLRPGMYVHSVLHVVRRKVPSVEPTAVVTEDDRNYCFLHREGKALRVPVRVGLRGSELVELLAKENPDGKWVEFSDKDEIIINPTSLTDGQAVKVLPGK